MDLTKIISDLYQQKRELDEAITALEKLRKTGSLDTLFPAAKRRGRKSMGVAERQKVSERMKRYWAGRRQAANPKKRAEPASEKQHAPPFVQAQEQPLTAQSFV